MKRQMKRHSNFNEASFNSTCSKRFKTLSVDDSTSLPPIHGDISPIAPLSPSNLNASSFTCTKRFNILSIVDIPTPLRPFNGNENVCPTSPIVSSIETFSPGFVHASGKSFSTCSVRFVRTKALLNAADPRTPVRSNVIRNSAVLSPSSYPLRETYTFSNPCRQQFAFPPTIMHYLINKPESRETYQKLMMTCKRFFARNPVVPAWDVYYNDADPEWIAYWDSDNAHKKRLFLQANSSKFLLWGRLDVQSRAYDDLITKLMPHVNRCELSQICVANQRMTMNEFKLLTIYGKIERFNFENVGIKNDNGSWVTFDKILEKLPDVQVFEFTFGKKSPIFREETMKNLVQILSNHEKLVSLSLHQLPPLLDFDTLAAFIVENQKLKIFLSFAAPLSLIFREKLQNFVNKLVESRPSQMPLIRFPGQDHATFQAMKALHS